jgi:GH24 family phage-related lysozyme (muramidase)
MKTKYWTIIIIIALVLFLFKSKIMELYSLVSNLLAKFEGFSDVPYWDVSRYSWGYGTRVPAKYIVNGKPKPGIKIDRIQAMADAWSHIQDSKSYLSPLVKISLTPDQWAAFLDFAYNEGDANADNLIPNMNAKKWSALEKQWKLYNKVKDKNGAYYVSEDLVKRRAAEWELFSSSLN